MKRFSLFAVAVALFLFVFPNAARAQFFFVDCSNPYALYPTINSALPFAGPGSFIAVNGPCNENVFINGAMNLNLGAAFGAATLNGNLSINGSQNVFLFGLNVTNPFGGDGIDVNSSHGVTLDACSSTGNGGNGLNVEGTSDVATINFGTFSNNGADGIFVGSNSLVNISSFGGTTEISNNQGSAVGIDRSVFSASGIHMAGNAHVAIDSRGAGKSVIFAFNGVNPSVIENNPKGAVSLQESSEISIGTVLPTGPNIISNNGPFGIEAGFGSQVTLVGVTITGHTGPGVDIYAHSQLYGTSQLAGLGATLIQNNASAGGPLNAGIRVDGNSETLLRGVTVSQNKGPAILALVNSSADLAGSTFTGNTGVITCDSSSTMVSDIPIAGRTPAAGVSCTTAHTLGNRAVNVPAPAVPDISIWKKLHTNYLQRLAAQK